MNLSFQYIRPLRVRKDLWIDFQPRFMRPASADRAAARPRRSRFGDWGIGQPGAFPVACGFRSAIRRWIRRCGGLLVEDFTHLLRQAVERERFLDEVHAFGEHAALADDFGCIAGHVEDPDVRLEHLDAFLQVLAAHRGHDHVGDQQVDFVLVTFAYCKGFARAAGAC